MKGDQYWREFDHQNVQTVYAVKGKKRTEIMADQFREDYFDIIDKLPGDQAARTHEEWLKVRREVGKPDKI